AAVELSATILLTTSESQAPMSYGIYLYMQSVAGRGPGAAMGVLAVVIVALGTYASHVIVERTSALTRSRQVDDEEPDALPEVKTHIPAPTAGQIAVKGTEVTS
ncbi:hypothetical protein ASE07_27055, partial [Noviherbaspirillum sp. Root189]